MNKLKVLFLLWISSGLYAQQLPVLTFEEAVTKALEHNLNLKIYKNLNEIAQLQNSYGAAGYLPKVDLNASQNFGLSNTNQAFSNGLEVNKSGVESQNTTAGVYLTWTFFDGKKMFATKAKLDLVENQSEIVLQQKSQDLIANIGNVYYQIVMQQAQIKGVLDNIRFSSERVALEERRLDLGKTNEMGLLAAQMDLSKQQSSLIQYELLLRQQKLKLNRLMQTDSISEYAVDSSFTLVGLQPLSEIETQVVANNLDVKVLEKNQEIAQKSLAEIHSLIYPKIGLTSSYVYGRSQNSAGFALYNQNLGLNVGLTFSWNLFNGHTTENQLKAAAVQVENQKVAIENLKADLLLNVRSFYQQWLLAQDLLKQEESQLKLAQKSVLIAMERLRLGVGTYLEVSAAQNAYETVVTKVANIQFLIKQSELQLLYLSGGLVK